MQIRYDSKELHGGGGLTSIIHSKKCNIRLPYVKHALNVRHKTYV